MKLLLSSSTQKDLGGLSNELTLRISNKLYELARNPYIRGSEKLAGNKGYRVRIGDYRVVYKIDKAAKAVTIIKVKHRREVYR